MEINRRRAASSQVSRDKKLGGHLREREYADLINATRILGTAKGDVKDTQSRLHSVKSGRKWQVFLYGYKTIAASNYLDVLQPCLDAFTPQPEQYFEDRKECIAFKEQFVRQHGKEKAKQLTNDAVVTSVGKNTYIQSKDRLALATLDVCEALRDRKFLRNFLGEAMFKNAEVTYLAVKDSTYKKDQLFKVFHRDDVLDILSAKLVPSVSKAGRVPEDYNVEGQKTLLRYMTRTDTLKNIVEIEVRNDSAVHYRQVRFNMYSKDTLHLLLASESSLPMNKHGNHVLVYGQAIESFS